jgi:hypothetical protein
MIKRYIISRFGEASTWKGIISALCGIGLFTLTGAQTDAIVGVCLAVYAAASVFFPDKVEKAKNETAGTNQGVAE